MGDDLDELDELLLDSVAPSNPSREESGAGCREETCLSFAFPDWGIDLSKQSIVRRHNPGGDDSEARCSRNSASPAKRKRWWSSVGSPRHGSPASEAPDEVLAQIMASLGWQDLCAARQVCKRWYSICSQDSLWERLLEGVNHSSSSSNDVPRWMVYKNSKLSSRLVASYNYPCTVYETLRGALESWWESGQADDHCTSATIGPLIRKVTLAAGWCLVYDFLTLAFVRRSDFLASSLLKLLLADTSSSPRSKVVQLLQSISRCWARYMAWVKLVSLHFPDLNCRIARTLETPSLYNKGIICFRSQVLLSYRIRGAVQEGLSKLSCRESQGLASEQDVELLCSLHHLLQELDVSDDLTLPAEGYTQMKLRRCFLDGKSSKEYGRSQILAARLNTAL